MTTPPEQLVVLESPLGRIGFLGNDDVLLGVVLPGGGLGRPSSRPRGPVIDAAAQMKEYLAGRRRQFDLPLGTDGTDFQLAVWSALETIPYGEVRSYGEIADQIGRPASPRPVGQAVGRNPHPIIRPCHRVVASLGLGGYDGQLNTKRALLAIEGALTLAEQGVSGHRHDGACRSLA